MSDKFEGNTAGLDSPPENLLEITPDDGNDLSSTLRCVNVAAAGTLRVTTVGGSTATVYVAAGIWFPIRAKRVFATGTSATGIVGGW